MRSNAASNGRVAMMAGSIVAAFACCCSLMRIRAATPARWDASSGSSGSCAEERAGLAGELASSILADPQFRAARPTER
jgi:hypothetical protein